MGHTKDIYRAAHELIRQHGEDAALEAAQRADELLERGDMEGEAVWLGIVRAINALLPIGPAGPGERVH